MALFENLSSRLGRIADAMRGKSRVTEKDIKNMMREIRLALLEADVNYRVVKELTDEIGEKALGAEVLESLTPGQQVVKIVHESLIHILGEEEKLAVSPTGFTVFMLYGLQGTGKTTAAAKLGLHLKERGKRPMLVSVDVHRPAAQEQLRVLAEQAGVERYINPEEKSAAVIAQQGIERAKYMMCDTLIVDTAGRMTVDDELMRELKEVDDVVKPDERLLIVDAMIGQEAVAIAEAFDRQIGLDGFIMTKLDGDARGGAALSIRRMTGKPIKMVGTGEKLRDLEVFHPDRLASRILGMGDVLTLIEKASDAFDEKQAQKTMDRLKANTFTMQDMLEQLEQIQDMGSMKEMISMIPGMGQRMGNLEVDERGLIRTRAIIQSMTVRERENPKLLNASRRRRIAAGSGMTVQDVNRVVRQYDDMLKLMKQFGMLGGKKGRRKRLPFGSGFGF
ncbi:MAG: signal recognition particle protein [Clostridiaceae bacterium]|jgi:signal recognition particle subunit SRP54|nr:signal recognition particle protein [Clostridia bacterium]MBP6950419.1 signal recognition particle protein [Clostridia bacterium]NMA35392.1 signal recognition particle protein [Clostridiaceae bacterium]